MKQRFQMTTTMPDRTLTVPELLRQLADAVRFVEHDVFLRDAAPDLRRAMDKITLTRAVALDVMREEEAGLGNGHASAFVSRRKFC